MKAGTAQKLVLNMITTAAMIRTGKVYNNLMVNLMPVNAKLIKRAHRMIAEVTGCSIQTAEEAFSKSDQETKTAIVMVHFSLEAEDARKLLSTHNGSINKVIDNMNFPNVLKEI